LVLAVYEPQGGALRVAKGAFQIIQELLGLGLAGVSYSVISANTVMVELSLGDNNTPLVFEHIFKPLPKYPSVQRDFSIVVPNKTPWEQIAQAVKEVSKFMEAIDVFDVYPEKGSIAFHVTFRSPERTLKSEEVDEVVKQINQLLINKFKATIR
jgi:phenylalanyl-tRNA synthetase beta chain